MRGAGGGSMGADSGENRRKQTLMCFCVIAGSTRSLREHRGQNMARFIIAVLLILSPFHALAEEASASEEAVWALEESYWRYVEENDIEKYKSLWDERFIGWPGGSERPVEKTNIADWIGPLHSDPNRIFKSEINREAVRAFGDVVVVHYSYRGYFISKDSGEVIEQWELGKITHTWQRRGDSWQIITGMAGRIVSE